MDYRNSLILIKTIKYKSNNLKLYNIINLKNKYFKKLQFY